MRISVIRPGDLGPDDIEAWRGLQRANSSLSNPFLSPDFAIAAARFRPQARVAVLSEGQSAAGFFPFERRGYGLGVPIAPGLTDCQGLVHAPGMDWDAGDLLRGCGLNAWRFDHLVDGQTQFAGRRSIRRASPVIDLSSGFDAYYQGLQLNSSQLAKNVPRRARKLGREAGELRFVLDSADSDALRALIGWKSAQYRATGQADLFARPWISGLIETLSGVRGDDFSGMLSVLYAGDIPVAAHFGIRSGPVLAHWFPAYSPEFGKYSPGLILHVRMAEAAANAGIGLIDLGTGAKRYKDELKTGDIYVAAGIATRRTPLGAGFAGGWSAWEWAGRTAKRHDSVRTFARWLRSR